MGDHDEMLDKLVDGMKSAFGEELVAVILYGSAASGEYYQKHSDLNVLVVVKNSRFHKVGRASTIARWWNNKGNPPLLFFTATEIQESSDVFPIEFSDMKERHQVLFGKDVLEGCTVDSRHLKLECEHELRGKLLNLRSRYVLVKGDVRESTTLLAESVSSFAVLFHAALRLVDKTVPARKAQIFDSAAAEFQFEARPFHEILAVRRGEKRLTAEEIDPLFERYFESIQKVIERVDSLN